MDVFRRRWFPLSWALGAILLWASAVLGAQGEISYKTPDGLLDNAGHPVSATVSITPSPNGLVVRVTNTTEHIVSFEQCISSVSFSLRNGESAHLGFTQGYSRIVYPDGIYTADTPEDTHWKLERAGARINLCSPGRTFNIIADTPGKKYDGADDSLIRAPGRNPFLTGTPRFDVLIPDDGHIQVVDIFVGWGSGSACCGSDTDMVITEDTTVTTDVGFLFGDSLIEGDIPLYDGGGGIDTGGGDIGGGDTGGEGGGIGGWPPVVDIPGLPPGNPIPPPIDSGPPITVDTPPSGGDIPEPASLAILGSAGLVLLTRKRRPTRPATGPLPSAT